MKQCSIKFEDDVWARIERAADATGLKAPDVLRQLILRFGDALISALQLPESGSKQQQ